VKNKFKVSLKLNILIIDTKNKATVFLFLIIFFTINTFASENFESTFKQNPSESFITIKGKVLDKKTKKPIVFVTIFAKGTNVSTVTNTDGEFIINVEKSLNVKYLSFKYIGYENKYVNINKLEKNGAIIYMQAT